MGKEVSGKRALLLALQKAEKCSNSYVQFANTCCFTSQFQTSYFRVNEFNLKHGGDGLKQSISECMLTVVFGVRKITNDGKYRRTFQISFVKCW